MYMYASVIWRYTLDANAAAVQCRLVVFECSTQLILKRYSFLAKAVKNRRNKDASGHAFPHSKISCLRKQKSLINENKSRFLCLLSFCTLYHLNIYLSPSLSFRLFNTHARTISNKLTGYKSAEWRQKHLECTSPYWFPRI